MTLSQADAQDAILEGMAFAMEAAREFREEWMGSTEKAQLKRLWALLSEAQKEALKQSDPEMFAQAQAYLQSQQ